MCMALPCMSNFVSHNVLLNANLFISSVTRTSLGMKQNLPIISESLEIGLHANWPNPVPPLLSSISMHKIYYLRPNK